MNLESIISISGYSGLFKVVGQTKSGIVVEGIEDGKRMAAYASHKVSALDDISIFTKTEDVPLNEVFQKIYDIQKGKEAINHKSSAEELKSFLEKALPDYDKDRVYVSDIKKLIGWYNILIAADLLKPEEKEKPVDDKKAAAVKAEKKTTKKVAPKKETSQGKPQGKAQKSKSTVKATVRKST